MSFKHPWKKILPQSASFVLKVPQVGHLRVGTEPLLPQQLLQHLWLCAGGKWVFSRVNACSCSLASLRNVFMLIPPMHCPSVPQSPLCSCDSPRALPQPGVSPSRVSQAGLGRCWSKIPPSGMEKSQMCGDCRSHHGGDTGTGRKEAWRVQIWQVWSSCPQLCSISGVSLWVLFWNQRDVAL